MKVVVFLTEDYSKADEFCMPDGISKNIVTQEVEKRFGEKGWWYYDIWDGETCEDI